MSKKYRNKQKPHTQQGSPTTPHDHDGGNADGGRNSEDEIPQTRWQRCWEWIELNNNQFLLLVNISLIVLTAGLYITAKETMVYGDRAFIYAKEALIVGDGKKPDERSTNPSFVVVTFSNSGNTPARFVRPITAFCAPSDILPDDFSYPLPIAPENQSGLVPPGGTPQAVLDIDNDTLQDIRTHKRNLYVYGTVKYRDIFKAPHHTDFCFQYNGYILKDDGTIDKYIFGPCPYHNCDDEGCPRKWGSNDWTCPAKKGFQRETPSN